MEAVPGHPVLDPTTETVQWQLSRAGGPSSMDGAHVWENLSPTALSSLVRMGTGGRGGMTVNKELKCPVNEQQ